MWALILLISFPISVFATSGACSGHGGVSCGAGIDSDGSVICNDGWRNSSVSYSSMVMCQGFSASPTPTTHVETSPTPTPVSVTPAVVIPVPVKSAATPKVIQQAPTKEVVRKTIENKATSTMSQIEAGPSLPIAKQVIQEKPAPKRTGFWAKLFSFFF